MTFFDTYRRYIEKFEGFSIINLSDEQEENLMLLMNIALDQNKLISKEQLIEVLGVDEDDPNILI
jgi:hypothetical protein|tara:strand:+ start:258 stop:452 length:195 start_codon:yes stop_codon:yes gene_type:complete